ncbi:MAG: hypothetical protein ACFE8L_00285 [Candidatus Hodarchaeota archaeon]
MFNLEEFDNNNLILIVDKLNQYLKKNKIAKVSKLIDELEDLLINQESLAIPITYILSILAEKNFELISERLIEHVGRFLHSDNSKLKINSIILIGFAIMAESKYYNKYSLEFIKFLLDESKDIRDNIHYFLLQLVKRDKEIVISNKSLFIESLLVEKSDENVISLLKLLSHCVELNFDQLYKFRLASKLLIKSHFHEKNSKIFVELLKLIKKFYPFLKEYDLENQKLKELINLLDNQFLMKKINFTAISKEKEINLKDFMNFFKNSLLKDEKVYFYTKSKDDIICIYEIEKQKLLNFFKEDRKISNEKIFKQFSQIIETDSELKIFIKTLLNLKIINGFYSNLGNFYPYDYLKSQLIHNFRLNGMVNLKNYNYLPPQFMYDLIQVIAKSLKEQLLLGKNKNAYYSLKKINDQINSEAAKNIIIDLKSYRERLLDKEFIKLIQNLPKEYLTNFHKGTQWLTNLGLLKLKKEIENSKLVGFFNINKVSDKYLIKKTLLMDILEHNIDLRSGIWDKSKEIFYYSKYLKERIDEISLIPEEQEKKVQIFELANELNIEENHILTKIDENLRLIGEEIIEKEQIKISEYLEKTGMENDKFIEFLNDLGLTYLKKGDTLIFNPLKIEDAKNDIKYTLIDRSRSADYISLGTFEITSDLVENLINDLLKDGKLKGIFYNNEDEIIFYTERGIRKLMLENNFLFSFHDLFYGKDLSEEEIKLLRDIFDDLVKKRKLRGNFDESSLTFSSDEVLFANDYNTNLHEFSKMVDSYIQKFDLEFLNIKKILTKKDETIYPKEIKAVEESIDRINEKYIFWREGLESFIRRVNIKLLRDQGYSIKKYKSLPKDVKEKQEIKAFEEDIEVYEHMKVFYGWIKLFNDLEIKYPNIIFYQKRFIKNSEDNESMKKYHELLVDLKLL